MMKRIFALCALGGSLFLSGCGGEHAPDVPPAANPGGSADNGSLGSGPTSGSVCFQATCLNTVAAATANAGRDYIYPDNKNYSDPNLRPQYRAPSSFLDLSELDLKAKVSQNFTLGEYVQPSKGRYAVLLPIVVTKTQAIRNSMGSAVYVTSGFRSPGHNSRISGSAKWSRHIYGDAVDMGAASQTQLEKECIAKSASFVLSYKDGHVHCDWRKVDLDSAFYTPVQSGPSLAFTVLSKRLSAELKIHATPSFANGPLLLSVELPEEIDLDEGEPTHRWNVRTPSGATLTFDTAEALLPADALRGTYYVEVVVGNTLRTTTSFEW
jgi:uncharacterized protein YcbK (DUF882 family)